MLDWTPDPQDTPNDTNATNSTHPYPLRFLDIPYDPAELTRDIRTSEPSTLAP